MRIAPWGMGLAVGVFLLLLSAPVRAGDTELTRDDGHREGKQSAAGTGHIVAFEAPRGEWWIRAVRIHGARYGGGYDPKEVMFAVAVCDEDLAPVTSFEAPYELFPAGRFDWVEVALPRVIRAPPRFKVVASFDPTATRGVFVGWAKSTAPHSTLGLPRGEERPAGSGREWMIRAVLTRKPLRDAVKEMVLRFDDGEMAGRQSLGGSGHVVEFRKPSGTWWIESILLHGQLYGGGYDPKTTDFDFAIATPKMNPLHEQTASYALFSRKGFSWAEVSLAEPVKAPSRFRVVVDFDPGRTKGVYLGYTETRKASHSFTGCIGGSASPWSKGEWMIRVRLVSRKPEPTSAAEPPVEPVAESTARDPKVYVKDFESIARTVRDHFPAFEKKGVDWKAVCAEWKPRFEACKDDETHVLHVRRLLALLGDLHTGVTDSRVEAHVPGFDGLFGAGTWIAAEGDHLVLRAWMPGHPLADRVRPGALLVRIDGRPTRIVHEEVRRQLRTWHGWSSPHFLDARLSFQFFPFGRKQTLPARFVNPDGEVVDVDLPRWGPRGRSLSRIAVTMPDGVRPEGKAVSTKLTDDIGYVRILGGMDEVTRLVFFEALDQLKGVKGILLDGRGMGGGGDGAAWAMAGRFFHERTPLKHDPAIRPTGDWQFDGPVVMLQDERMISSAETFTWAMAETGRALTVGRPTGGATIIPRTFDVPSKLFRLRLGCRDRETSVKGVRPEGVGSPPDVFVPYDPVLLDRAADPVFAVGLDVLRLLVSGAPREVVVGVYGGVLGADPDRLRPVLDAWQGLERPGDLHVADLTGDLVDALIGSVIARGDAPENLMPDVRGAAERLERLGAVATWLGRDEAARRARAAPGRWRKEIGAQEAFDSLCTAGSTPSPAAVRAYAREHEGTRWATAVAEAFD